MTAPGDSSSSHSSCPGPFDLELHLENPDPRVRDHVARCAACRERLTELRKGAAFLEDFGRAIASVPDDDAHDAADSEGVERYEIVRVIGRGGQGIVYEARQVSTGRSVALKLLVLGLDPGTRRQRFEREIHFAASLRHSHVVTIFDSGTNARGRPYLAMELVEGKAVVEDAKERTLSVQDKLLLFEKICDAVGHAHRRGVIHRDLKPGNVLVDRDGEPRVLDFGLAKTLRGDAPLTSAAFSADGTVLAASAQDGSVRAWHLSDAGPVEWTSLRFERQVNALAFAGPERLVAADDGGVSVIDLESGRTTSFRDHASRVPGVATAPDGTTIYSASMDGSVVARRGDTVKTLYRHERGARVLHLSGDGRLLPSGSDDATVKLFDVSEGTLRATLTEHRDRVFAVAFHPMEPILASGDASGVVLLSDTRTGRRVAALNGHEGLVLGLDFSPEGSTLVSASSAGVVVRWRLDHFDRHLRGGLVFHFERLAARLALDPAAVERWRRWAIERR